MRFIALTRLQRGEINDTEFFSLFTGIPVSSLKRIPEFFTYSIQKQFAWINELKPYNAFFVREVKCGSTKLISPEPLLRKMTFGQFIFADTSFISWIELHDATDLNRFFASLYLSAGVEFSDEAVAASMTVVNDVPDSTKEAVALNWHMIREWLGEVYPLIFAKPKDDGKEKPRRQVNNTWIKMFEQMVGDDIINQDRYASVPIQNIFRYMTSRIRESYRRPSMNHK